jgi:hypothetical protein
MTLRRRNSSGDIRASILYARTCEASLTIRSPIYSPQMEAWEDPAIREQETADGAVGQF